MCARSSERGPRFALHELTLVMALCAAIAPPARAASGSASAAWALRLDDHRVEGIAPGGSGARVAPWTQAVSPAVGFTARPLGARLAGGASGRLEVGAPVPGEGLGPLRRGSAAEVHAGLARAFATGLRLTAGASGARSRDLLDVDHATVSANADAVRWAASAGADSRPLEARWRVRGWRSDAAASTDARSLAWGARAFLLRPAAGALFVGGHERRIDREREMLLRARTAALGVRRDVAPGLSATLECGAVEERLGSGRDGGRPTAALELATVDDDDARATRLRVRIARELGTEFEVELGRRAGRASAWARASSAVDIEGSASASPAVIQRAGVGVADTLAGAVALGVEASVARNRPYRGLPLEHVRAARVGAWVERRVQPWLTCRAAWDLLGRTGDGPGAAPGFRRSRFELQLRANTR